MLDLLVVHSPCGGGHRAAALAVHEAAQRRGLRSEVLDLFDLAPSWAARAYLFAHFNGQRRIPSWYGAGYHATNERGGAWESLRLTVDRVIFSSLRDHVRACAPRAIVSTHHLPLVVLAQERRKRRLEAPVTCVVTDYAAHACWAERDVDMFCVPSLFALANLERHGVPRARMEMTGIPVRRAFEEIPTVRAPAPGEKLRVLVTSGGFGVGPMESIARSFAGVRDVALTIVCGAAREVETQVRAAAPFARVIGAEPDMAARVAEAHVVIGKAGGLTVSETLAAGRPMIVVGAVPGNEKQNETFVTGGGAGVVAEPEQAASIALQLRDNHQIEPMGERARMLVVRGASERVLLRALPKTSDSALA